jgi:cell division protein FtsB
MKKRSQHKLSPIQKILYSKLFSGVSIFVALFMIGAFVNNYQKAQVINDEIAAQQQSVDDMKLENQQLESEIAYYHSQDFVEVQAKKKLGLQRPDEQALIVPDAEIDKIIHIGRADETEKNKPEFVTTLAYDDTPNVVAWWQYFFKQ